MGEDSAEDLEGDIVGVGIGRLVKPDHELGVGRVLYHYPPLAGLLGLAGLHPRRGGLGEAGFIPPPGILRV